jgi:redox-sensitive bicupin YhaK (pirin superfamily)
VEKINNKIKNNGFEATLVAENNNKIKGDKSRSINKILNSIETKEGAGFIVHRPFPSYSLSEFDPFLLLDEMGPMNLKPGEAKGAPDHPHRGFETVTYMLSGKFEHKDSRGNSGKLNPGDVQWMTAGSGVIHSEMPSKDFTNNGGRLHGLQLWINLPKKDKMSSPHYQDISSVKIPVVKMQDGKGSVRVIAGKAFDTQSVIDTKIPIIYLHFTLEPGSKEVIQPVPHTFNAFAYIISGEGHFGKDKIHAHRGQMVIFSTDGEDITIKADENTKEKLEVLLIAGKPINEPIARYGPFVMNTKDEIYEAIRDYQSGRLGTISH